MAKIMSKGSKQRPTNQEKFSEGWDRIFAKEEFEMQCRELYGDSMPSTKALKDTVRKELIRLGRITESEQL